jgi:hypothetical protein
VRTEPDAFAVVADFGRAVRFEFDERISEQIQGGTLDDAVTVSPRSGEVRVRHGSRSLRVEVEGGLRAGVVYRVTLHAVVRDLFGNQLRDPFELVFSTGGEPTPTALAGEVWDRVTGQGARGALLHAVGPDQLVYVARADDQGIFAFRYLPAGTFEVTGFDDVDRDGEVDPREVKGSTAATLATGDTLLIDVPILAPDTTPAVLARASALDSITVVLETDDYLDPAVASDGIDVTLAREAGAAPGVSRVFHEHEYASYARAVADSLTAAGAPADSAAAPPRPPGTPGGGRGTAPEGPSRVGPPQLPGARAPSGGRGASGAPTAGLTFGRVLPGRRMVALLDAPLELDTEYEVRVGSVRNLNGLPGGGGTATLLLEAPPPATADTTAAPDSLAVPAAPAAPAAGNLPDTASPPGGRP